jgi:Icc-related predicted phosphoesterase
MMQMREHPCDIFMFAGDLQESSLDDGNDFIDWVSELPHTHKILIFGNHDSNYENILEYSKQFKDITFLNNESAVVEGIHIFGSPYSPKFGNWWFMKKDKDLAEIYDAIPENTEIILSHSPAFGFQDESILTHASCGSMSLRDRVFQLPKLEWVISGHIHEGYGVSYHNNVGFMNASLLNSRYEMANDPIYVNYKNG